MDKEELKGILEDHRLWLNNAGGRQADLHGADLHRVDLSGFDLSRADLNRANLRGINLYGANLAGVDFRGSDLTGAELSVAYLRCADLSGAKLCWANLREACLYGASLNGADLSRATICGADFRRTDFRGSNLDRVAFDCSDISLFCCEGLDWKMGRNVASHLLYQVFSIQCDDPGFIKIRNYGLDYANRFYGAKERGLLLPRGKGMSVYQATTTALGKAEKKYKQEGGFINKVRLEYWRRKYNRLTIGEAAKQVGGRL
jgi:hypothetical protein